LSFRSDGLICFAGSYQKLPNASNGTVSIERIEVASVVSWLHARAHKPLFDIVNFGFAAGALAPRWRDVCTKPGKAANSANPRTLRPKATKSDQIGRHVSGLDGSRPGRTIGDNQARSNRATISTWAEYRN
jgi:hypothetical protein